MLVRSWRAVGRCAPIPGADNTGSRPWPGRSDVDIDATADLVDIAAAMGARIVHTSTDLVFDGKAAPYRESSVPSPSSVYGRSKLASERPVLAFERGVVVRPSLMFGLMRIFFWLKDLYRELKRDFCRFTLNKGSVVKRLFEENSKWQ